MPEPWFEVWSDLQSFLIVYTIRGGKNPHGKVRDTVIGIMSASTYSETLIFLDGSYR